MTDNEKRVLGEKASFVQMHLAPMVKAIDKDVRSVTYRFNAQGSEKIVITRQGGFTQFIDVTADSFTALARDVLAKI